MTNDLPSIYAAHLIGGRWELVGIETEDDTYPVILKLPVVARRRLRANPAPALSLAQIADRL